VVIGIIRDDTVPKSTALAGESDNANPEKNQNLVIKNQILVFFGTGVITWNATTTTAVAVVASPRHFRACVWTRAGLTFCLFRRAVPFVTWWTNQYTFVVLPPQEVCVLSEPSNGFDLLAELQSSTTFPAFQPISTFENNGSGRIWTPSNRPTDRAARHQTCYMMGTTNV
jgi:hypothetical protein